MALSRESLIRWNSTHDDVIKWKQFPRCWPFMRGIHRSRGALIFSLVCAWISGWVNDREAGGLRHHRAQYDVIVMNWFFPGPLFITARNVIINPLEASKPLCMSLELSDRSEIRYVLAGVVPRCLSNFREITLFHNQSCVQLRDFASSGGETSYRLVE